MIVFQTKDGFQYDLTGHGLTFNEESPLFSTETKSSFVFPFKAPLDSELAIRLGMVTEENVSSYSRRVNGYLIVDNEFYDAYLNIYEIGEYDMEIRLFYGKEVLEVFNKKLSELPFPIVDTGDDLNDFSLQSLSRSWPDITHNFPMVYRPDISENSDYGHFNGYMNWRTEDLSIFRTNSNILVEGELVPQNRNVVCPMPYLLEVFKVAFKSAGYEIRGEFVNHPLARKMVYIPKKYFQYYSDPVVRSVYTFNNSSNIVNEVQTFTRVHVPSKNGTYTLHTRLNFPKGVTKRFSFSVTYNDKTYYGVNVQNEGISIDELLEINVQDDIFTPIQVTLSIDRQQRSIDGYTHFVFDYRDGRVNAFPQRYSLKEVLPDMKFREFYDSIVQWLNLDVVYFENSVYLNFKDNTIQRMVYEDHTYFEDPKKSRGVMNNNLYKLTYPDGKKVLVTSTGQVYDESEYTVSEINPVDFSVMPVKVFQLNGFLTGEWPNDYADSVVLGLYDGLQGGQPVLVESVDGFDLSLQSVYDNFHKFWLSFRTNSETYKDKFFMQASNVLDMLKGSFRYNKKHLIKKIRKVRVNEEYWQVNVESESF